MIRRIQARELALLHRNGNVHSLRGQAIGSNTNIECGRALGSDFYAAASTGADAEQEREPNAEHGHQGHERQASARAPRYP